jgi:hypothetical protein
MHYEIHVTVETDNIDKFRQDCYDMSIKPIVIETYSEAHGTLELGSQVMTSSKYNGHSYNTNLETISNNLQDKGYKILRQKVEKFPNSKPDSSFIYYESHLRLKLPKNFNRDRLNMICKKAKLHLSKNLFKRDANYDYQMITYRTSNPDYKVFVDIIELIKLSFDANDIPYDKVEIEECIFDSNVSLDNRWLN